MCGNASDFVKTFHTTSTPGESLFQGPGLTPISKNILLHTINFLGVDLQN